MLGKRKLAAVALAGTLTALTPQFAAAHDSHNTCSDIARQQGIHSYQTHQGTQGFQENRYRGLGCEFKVIGGRWRVMNTYNIHSANDSRRFYNRWDNVERQARNYRPRHSGGLGRTNNGINDIGRTIRNLDRLFRNLERLTK